MGIARHAWTLRYGAAAQIQWAAKCLIINGFSAVLLYSLTPSPTAISPGVTTCA